MAKKHDASMGSIGSGTLRSEDLLASFSDHLEWLAPRGHGKLIREARQIMACLERDGRRPPRWLVESGLSVEEMAGEIVHELTLALDELVPEYCHFGTHEADGADFGFWPCMGAIEELECFEDTDGARAERFKPTTEGMPR